MQAARGEQVSDLRGVLPKCAATFHAGLCPFVIPSEVEESLILRITSSKRCLDCARHDKKVGVMDLEGLTNGGLLKAKPPVVGLLGSEILQRHDGIIDFG
jgi:hypothetical protein